MLHPVMTRNSFEIHIANIKRLSKKLSSWILNEIPYYETLLTSHICLTDCWVWK